jgi:D-alanyl-D-alanine carboxypeptidase
MYSLKTMYRPQLLVSMILLIISITSQTAGAEPLKSRNPYIVVDAATGAIITQHKANDRWYPASLTKLMTAYVTFRAIKTGQIEAGSPVTISAAAIKQPPSRMGYKQGIQLRIDTALKIIIIKSANDVSHALGEAVAGSLQNFVAKMNNEARRLGMANTRFTNSNGLHNANQYSSARDMALLSAQILREFPEYAYMFEAVAIKTPVKTHYSYNLLLERFSGANGLKTGFVCAAGYNLAGSARRNGRTLIAVVLGTASQTDRAITAAHLLEEGFGNIQKNLGNIFKPVSGTGAKPKNMRPVLCTQKARSQRYDPAAGQAKISSVHLQPRRISSNILNITTGGITGPVSSSRPLNIPVPSKRPGKTLDVGPVVLETIGNAATGIIPLPTKRP